MSNHPPCRCGCGELADECAGTSPNPLGSLHIDVVGREAHPVCAGDCGLDRCPTNEAQREADDAAREAAMELAER